MRVRASPETTLFGLFLRMVRLPPMGRLDTISVTYPTLFLYNHWLASHLTACKVLTSSSLTAHHIHLSPNQRCALLPILPPCTLSCRGRSEGGTWGSSPIAWALATCFLCIRLTSHRIGAATASGVQKRSLVSLLYPSIYSDISLLQAFAVAPSTFQHCLLLEDRVALFTWIETTFHYRPSLR